jgi:hypothetical protein
MTLSHCVGVATRKNIRHIQSYILGSKEYGKIYRRTFMKMYANGKEYYWNNNASSWEKGWVLVESNPKGEN